MAMLPKVDRAVFTIRPHDGGWAVEHEGAFLDPSPNRDEAMAAAVRRARASHETGRPAQIL